jgi:hypothetical protein
MIECEITSFTGSLASTSSTSTFLTWLVRADLRAEILPFETFLFNFVGWLDV